MNSRSNILFYSKKCGTCRNLFNVLKNENLLDMFQLFCVDDRLNQLPIHIKMVPTMIISNYNKPLVAHETFEWVKSFKFIRQQKLIELNKKIIQDHINSTSKNGKGPKGYKSLEMQGISDSYAFTDVDVSLPHSFATTNDNSFIFTAPSDKKKLTKDEQKTKINELESMRKNQDKTMKEIMADKQIKEIVGDEHTPDKNNTNQNINAQTLLALQRMLDQNK